jgi:LEA14-like dessication related protein
MSCTSASTSDRLRRAGLAAAAGAAMFLAACTAVPSLQAPKASVAAVRLDRLTGIEARFAVLVDLVNPNDREIAVDAIEADLTIESIAVGTARLASPLRLPALGEATATLDVRAAWAEALRAFATGARRTRVEGGTAALRYAVTGFATLAGGGTIPFSRTGEFVVPAGTTPRP